MKVELLLYASLKNYLPGEKGKTVMEVEKGTTVQGLLSKLGISLEIPRIIFLNGVHAQGNEVLKDGDRVGAFPPVAGG